MPNIDPKWLLLATVVLTLATMGGAVSLWLTGHAESVVLLTNLSIPLIATLLAAMVTQSHREAATAAVKVDKAIEVAVNGKEETVKEIAAVVKQENKKQTVELKEAIKQNGHG